MTFVINLSKPFNFFPFYDNIPLELLTIDENSILKHNISILSKKLDGEFILLQNETKFPVDIINNVVFFPKMSFFNKLFLLTSFINANFFNPKVFVMSGNVIFDNVESMIKMMNKIIKDEFFSHHPFLFFGNNEVNCNSFIEKDDFKESINGLELFSFKRFLNRREYEILQKKDNLIGFLEFFYFHSLRLKEVFCSNEESADLYFLCEGAWQHEENWQDVVEKLANLNIEEIIIKEKPLILPLSVKAKFYNKIVDLLDFFKTDEHKNIIRGNVNIENVYGSIIINTGENEIIVRNESGLLILSDGYVQRIESL